MMQPCTSFIVTAILEYLILKRVQRPIEQRLLWSISTYDITYFIPISSVNHTRLVMFVKYITKLPFICKSYSHRSSWLILVLPVTSQQRVAS